MEFIMEIKKKKEKGFLIYVFFHGKRDRKID